MNRNVLTISGLDPSGCTGLTVDLKTLMAWRMYGMAIATAVVSQNTQRVENVYPVPMEVIGTQLEMVTSDIEIHAVKIGFLPNAKTMELVVELLRAFSLNNVLVKVVWWSPTGYQFADEKMMGVYKEKLFPLAECVVCNIEEASALTGIKVSDVIQMKLAAEALLKTGTRNVVVTAAILRVGPWMCITTARATQSLKPRKSQAAHTHGLGDTFSAILTAHLAKKVKIVNAIDPAKKYLARAMVHPFKIGAGNGPLNHNVAI